MSKNKNSNQDNVSGNKRRKKSPRRLVAIVMVAVVIIILFLAGKILETNKVGHIQVKQAAVTGTMSVRTSPGTYFQSFGDITDYLYSDAIFLSAEDLDGGSEAETRAIAVLFPDGSCDVDFVGQYEVRADQPTWLKIKERYPTHKQLKSMIRQQVVEVITNTASLMNAEDAYSSKRSDFIRLCREQLVNGLYKPTFEVVFDTIQGGQVQETRIYDVDYNDDTGKPIISKEPLLGDYGIVFSQFNIKKLHNFDERTVELIDKRKEAKAMQQAAITAKAKGEADIATEKAEQEAIKIKEVTQAEKVAAVAIIEAEKLFKVAEFKAKEASEEKKKLIAEGEGQAEANWLKVKAGLTPQEEMERDIKIADVVSKNISNAPTPFVVFGAGASGGGADGSGVGNVMEVFGAERALALVKLFGVDPAATPKAASKK